MTSAELRWRQGCGFLVLGRYGDGFQLFECRMDVPGAACTIPPQLRWRGQPGKNVLLCTEGGIGDAIFFMRYLPMVRDVCKHVGLQFGHPELESIIPSWLKRPSTPDIGWDYMCSLQSLPAVFQTNENNIPPPFEIEPDKLQDRVLFAKTDKVEERDLWVGVRWSGNPDMSANLARSMTFEQFRGIFGIPGVQYVSLYEQKNTQDRPPLIDFGLEDLAHTAALISHLDLVITVDTSVAHLAASLRVPTWILVPRIEAYWIWGLTGMRTPWYPTARLMRQGRAEDWEDTIEWVRKDLETVVGASHDPGD